MSDDPTPDSGHDPRVEALGRASRSIPVGPLDAAGVVRAARARRRRRTVLGSALAAVLVVAGVAVTTAAAGGRSGDEVGVAAPSSTPSTPVTQTDGALPDPPAGSRWIGAAGVAVAVPSDWPVVANACTLSSLVENVVSVRTGPHDSSPDDRCEDSRPETTGLVVIAPLDREDDGTDGRAFCRASFPGTCSGSVGLPEVGVTVRVRIRSTEDGGGDAQRILDSVTPLPAGWTAVPFGGEGRSTKRSALLEAAGLRVDDSPIVDELDGPVSSRPVSGTVVPVGSTVVLTPGGGPDADPDSDPRDFDVDYTFPVDATDLAAGAARWDSRDGTLTYRPREEGSSCPADPSGSFSDTRFYLVLTVRDGVVCDAPLGGVYVVRGLRRAPEELTVTEQGEARTVRVDRS